MLSGVFHLHEQEARQVMTPIPAVVTVDLSEDVETALRRCISSGHTRLVVTEDDNRDRVRGIVHSNRLAQALMAEGPQASLEPLVREAVIVPETKPLDDLLADLQRQRSSMAVVVDEYGRVVGIVTVEDIIEEVVGEIDDETDPAGGADPAAGQRRLVRPRPRRHHRPARPRRRAAGRHRRLQLGRRLRLRRAGPAAQARRSDHRRRLLDPRRVGAREPHRGRPHPRAPRPAGRGLRQRAARRLNARRAKAQVLRVAAFELLERAPERGRTDRGFAASRSWDSDAATERSGWARGGPVRFAYRRLEGSWGRALRSEIEPARLRRAHQAARRFLAQKSNRPA